MGSESMTMTSVLEVLPAQFRAALRGLDWDKIQELRLRSGYPLGIKRVGEREAAHNAAHDPAHDAAGVVRAEDVAAVLAAAALVLFHSVAFVKDLISVFEDLFTLSGIDNMYLTILFKSLGICYIVQLASDYCRDCGENALASQVTLAGKLAMLSVSLPLFKAFVEIVKALLI